MRSLRSPGPGLDIDPLAKSLARNQLPLWTSLKDEVCSDNRNGPQTRDQRQHRTQVLDVYIVLAIVRPEPYLSQVRHWAFKRYVHFCIRWHIHGHNAAHDTCRLQEESDKSRRLTGKQYFLQQASRIDSKDEVNDRPASVVLSVQACEVSSLRLHRASADGPAVCAGQPRGERCQLGGQRCRGRH